MKFGSNAKTISDDSFGNCTALKQIEIPSSVATIGNYAFSNYSSFKSNRTSIISKKV